MVEGSKQVRVDNWGIFFLQRLQIFFSKTDYCDLTLQFEGNVQLKVHRLVMNACTEYFTYLEQTCRALEEGTIIMPADLQADVIVPIVNFMYTGMLEFHISIFEKLYKAAVIMNITVLTKLLDAQRKPTQPKTQKRKFEEVITPSLSIKSVPKPPLTLELPPPLPGRKVPVWKRKTAPTSSHSDYSDKWSSDPLMMPDARPKPTRFEWPDEDLPPLPLMDSTFEEISYTSKPLLTQEEEIRAISNVASTSSSSEDVNQASPNHNKKNVSKAINENSQEGKTRTKSESSGVEEIILFDGEEYGEIGQKRKGDANTPKVKRSKNGDKENKETSINVKANTAELDHTKIVSEILKKYPNLVRKNKNIKLKIMPVATPTKKSPPEKPIPGFNEIRRKVVRADSSTTIAKQKLPLKHKKKKEKISLDGPWICDKCDGNPVEFVLYYLYRKHMTDVHNEVFDIRLCKYCGQKCSKPNLMMYHLLTKHGLKPPATYAFPKCDQCPFIALSESKLILHKQKHQANEMQCTECKLAFTNQSTLTTHLQITGHLNRSGRSSFDCQYCTKKLQSPINLFSHIKNTHFKDAKKDGIVGLDELEELDEDNDSEEEYMIPEILTENDIQKDKVKIISNVKVQNLQESHNEQQLVPLVQTSEADSLNNVTGSIATSLGLVDIVVLDDNQQYILQENQEQTEFILPELSSGESHFGAQVITTQHNTVIPQGVLQASGTDITSTDELVMVLTDHDYQEGHEGENADNSNIVVLYSHPVDGQQGQFITSQGNLLVNSQTGMLELRNGTTITTTSNQLVVNNEVETPIESIEMIQREIQSQQELEGRKQNTADHSQSKQVESNTVSLEELTGEQVIINEFTGHKGTILQESTENEVKIQIERTEINQCSKQNPEIYLAHEDVQDTCVETIEMQGNISEEQSEEKADNRQMEQSGISELEQTPGSTSEVSEIDMNKDISDNKDSTDGNNLQEFAEGHEDEPMEIEETHTTDVITTDSSKIAEVEETAMEECETTSIEDHEQLLETVENDSIENPVGVDVPPETVNTVPESVDIEPGNVALSHELVDLPSKVDTPIEHTDAHPEQVDICPTETKTSAKKLESPKHFEPDLHSPTPLSGNDQETDSPINVEEMEVDGPDKEEMTEKKNQNVTKSQQTDTVNSDTLQECVISIDDDQNKKDEQSEIEDLSNTSVAEQAEDEDEEDSCFVEKEENSVVLESCIKSPPKNASIKTNPNINREILQDWDEDTDSQQSEKQNNPKDSVHQVETESDSSKDGQRQAAVDKLMNDWEDEEEEDKKDE